MTVLDASQGAPQSQNTDLSDERAISTPEKDLAQLAVLSYDPSSLPEHSGQSVFTEMRETETVNSIIKLPLSRKEHGKLEPLLDHMSDSTDAFRCHRQYSGGLSLAQRTMDTRQPSRQLTELPQIHWLDTMASFVQSTDPIWFSRLQMDLHHDWLDRPAMPDEESSHVYLIKSRYGNMRGKERSKTKAELEEAGISNTNMNVHSDDELVGTYHSDEWFQDDSSEDPLLLDTNEADLTKDEENDRDLAWWMKQVSKKKSLAQEGDDLGGEKTPKIRRPTSRHAGIRKDHQHAAGDMGRKQAILAILKGFVGTGMLFLPHAVSQGGLLFSTIVIILVWLTSLYSMVLLIDCAEKSPLPKHAHAHTFGSIGRVALGRVGSTLVNTSVFMAQLGFCTVYSVFVSKNVADIMNSRFGIHLATTLLIYCLIPILIPVSWIRKLKHLTPAILLANVFVSTASITIIVIAIGIVALSGPSPHLASWHNIVLNGDTWPLTLGFSLYVWEGIGLVIPIKNSLKPEEAEGARFASTLGKTMTFILLLYLCFGGLLFCTYGENVNQVILLSLPETPLTVLLQVMFTVSCLCSFPLQFFPAARIMERFFISRIIQNTIGVDKLDPTALTWLRNFTRSMLVLATIGIAVTMQARIDLLTSFIGCLCCLPLSLIYPVLFHLVTRPEVKTLNDIESFDLIIPKRSSLRKLPVRPMNYAVLVFGILAMFFTGQETTRAFYKFMHPTHPPITPTLKPTHAPSVAPERSTQAQASTGTLSTGTLSTGTLSTKETTAAHKATHAPKPSPTRSHPTEHIPTATAGVTVAKF